MRWPALILLNVFAAGCASAPRPDTTQAMSTYIVVKAYGADTCYFRLEDDVPADKICVTGDFVRYSQHPKDLADAPQIPPYVTALFANTAVIEDLDHVGVTSAPLPTAAPLHETASR